MSTQASENRHIPVVPVDYLLPLYKDYREEQKALEAMDRYYVEGLVTIDEAMWIMEGRQSWQ